MTKQFMNRQRVLLSLTALGLTTAASSNAEDIFTNLAVPSTTNQCGSEAIPNVSAIYNNITLDRELNPGLASVAKKVEIPIVFTVFYDSAFPVAAYEFWRENYWPERAQAIIPNLTDGRLVTEESVMIAMERLNKFYQGTHFSFVLYDGVIDPIRYRDSAQYFFAADASGMPQRPAEMAEFGVDYPNVLNIFVHMMTELGPTGWGAFPSQVAFQGEPWGIDVDFRTFPGLNPDRDPGPKAKDNSALDVTYPTEMGFAEYNGVLAHEVGHNIGLFHTFSESTPQGAGDMVDDTPFEAVPFSGDGIIRSEYFEPYPLDRNTVDDSWYWKNGKDPSDPVYNVMDYGHFHINEFEITKGQVDHAFRMMMMYLPQFVTRSKAAKPAKDRLFVYADFEDEALNDGQVTNKAKKGKKIPVHVLSSYDLSLPAASASAELMSLAEDQTVLELQGGAHLYASEDDLSNADVANAPQTSTVSFWLRADDPTSCGNVQGVPYCAGFSLGSYSFHTPAVVFDYIPYLPWAPDVAVIRWNSLGADGTVHSEYWTLPSWVLLGWNHFAIVNDADVGNTIYLNGGAATLGIPYGPSADWTHFKFGHEVLYDQAGNPVEIGMSGWVDELAIYNIALSQEEVENLASNGADNVWLKGNYRTHVTKADDETAQLLDEIF